MRQSMTTTKTGAEMTSVFNLAAFEAAAGPERTAFATEVDRICRNTGFLAITGHGVPQSVIDAQWAAVNAFFDLPFSAKRALTPATGDPYGYLAHLSEALAASKGEITPPDLKESFNGGPLATPDGASEAARAFCYRPTPWPDVPGFRPAWQAYYVQMEGLAARLMALFAAALNLPEDHFDPFINTPISALRALNYPATPEAPEAGQQRAGAHTDYGSLTLLLPQSGSSGLEIETPNGWQEVSCPPGAFVVNIGDLMARWTADRWVSTLHRVVAKAGQPPRKSLAFFHQPNWGAEITPMDGSDAYPPVLSGPYLMDKFRATSA